MNLLFESKKHFKQIIFFHAIKYFFQGIDRNIKVYEVISQKILFSCYQFLLIMLRMMAFLVPERPSSSTLLVYEVICTD